MSASPIATLNLFLRDPERAECKTRLADVLDKRRRARLADDLVRWTAALAVSHWPGPVRLRVEPATAAAGVAVRYRLPAFPQQGRDLGERMGNVLAASCPGNVQVVLGCDVPHLAPATLTRAARWVLDGRNVLGPATDGGFYLVAVQRYRDGLFRGIDWGTGSVRDRLLRNACALGIVFDELEPMCDIDRADDLAAAAEVFPPLREYEPGAADV